MSEEIASADALMHANADLSRQIGELNTTIGYQDAMLLLAQSMVDALLACIARDGYCPICHQTEVITLQTGYYTHHEGCALDSYQELVASQRKANDHA